MVFISGTNSSHLHNESVVSDWVATQIGQMQTPAEAWLLQLVNVKQPFESVLARLRFPGYLLRQPASMIGASPGLGSFFRASCLLLRAPNIFFDLGHLLLLIEIRLSVLLFLDPLGESVPTVGTGPGSQRVCRRIELENHADRPIEEPPIVRNDDV
jgi:hypothetical protein